MNERNGFADEGRDPDDVEDTDDEDALLEETSNRDAREDFDEDDPELVIGKEGDDLVHEPGGGA